MKIFRLAKATARFGGKVAAPVTRPATGLVGRWWQRLSIWLGGEPARRQRRAHQLAAGLSAELHRLGFSRRVHYAKRKVKLNRVRFLEPLLLTKEELWCPIDLTRLPSGVKTNDLRDEDVLRSIEDRLNASVRIDYLANGQMAFVIKISGLAFPEILGINAFKLPAEAPALAIPLGLDGEGQHRWADLAKMPHLLIVGPTGKGKSNFVHAMLTTWLSRNTDKDIELWLADHKGGVELNRYKDLMGTKGRPGIVRRFSYNPEDTIEFLQTALRELERRNELLRQSNSSDVDDYARTTGLHLRRIAIVIDEIFFLMLNKDKIDPEVGKKSGGMSISQWAEHLFSKIASAGRAAGVHLVISTQKIGKDVLTGLITANFETRLVFGLASMYESIYVLGDSSAVGMPKGRIIFREEGGKATEIQSPLIKPDQTRLLIQRISRYGPDGGLGKRDEALRFCEDAKLLITVASEEFEGRFAIAQMWQHERVKGAVKKDRVEEIARRLEKDGVLTPGGPKRARRLYPAFVSRPELLDSMYGPDAAASVADTTDEPGGTLGQGKKSAGRGPDVAPSPVSVDSGADMPEAHQDGADDKSATSDIRQERAGIAPTTENEGPDTDLPPEVRKFLDGLEGSKNS